MNLDNKRRKTTLNAETLSPMAEKYLSNAQISNPLLQLLNREKSYAFLSSAC